MSKTREGRRNKEDRDKVPWNYATFLLNKKNQNSDVCVRPFVRACRFMQQYVCNSATIKRNQKTSASIACHYYTLLHNVFYKLSSLMYHLTSLLRNNFSNMNIKRENAFISVMRIIFETCCTEVEWDESIQRSRTHGSREA